MAKNLSLSWDDDDEIMFVVRHSHRMSSSALLSQLSDLQEDVDTVANRDISIPDRIVHDFDKQYEILKEVDEMLRLQPMMTTGETECFYEFNGVTYRGGISYFVRRIKGQSFRQLTIRLSHDGFQHYQLPVAVSKVTPTAEIYTAIY